MNAFLALFPTETITSIYLNLYNGTGSGFTELPNGGHIEQNAMTLHVLRIQDLKPALDSITYNQIQKCSLSFKENNNATLNLLERSLSLSGIWPMEILSALIKFCKENEVRKLTMCF
jgi:hypothetical protein